jgi:hypothetical protein
MQLRLERTEERLTRRTGLVLVDRFGKRLGMWTCHVTIPQRRVKHSQARTEPCWCLSRSRRVYAAESPLSSVLVELLSRCLRSPPVLNGRIRRTARS